MHAKDRGQFDISGAAGAGDKNQVIVPLPFGEDLVHIGTQHLRLNNRQLMRGASETARGISAEECKTIVPVSGSR